MNEYIDQKLDLTRQILLDKWPDEIVVICVIGSIIQEKTEHSDLDVAVVFNDDFFMKNISNLRSEMQTIAQDINKEFAHHHLTIWPSKKDHYLTYLPDVSYVRANLFHSLTRLDAWCGLAKHTLHNYENVSHKNLYGQLDRILHIYPTIPRYEALELFLIATRILAEGIVESLDSDPTIRRNGISHLAKAGLRAAYAVCISDKCPPCNSYQEIRDRSIAQFPENYHPLIGQLHMIKISDDITEIDSAEIISFFRYCENQIARVMRPKFSGVVAGSKGESFAYNMEVFTEQDKDVAIESYSRYVGPHVNYIHMLYFITSASEIVRRFSNVNLDNGLLLDFFFEELITIYTFALEGSQHLRILLGRQEQQTIDLFFKYENIIEIRKIIVHLYNYYEKTKQIPELPWFPASRKRILMDYVFQPKVKWGKSESKEQDLTNFAKDVSLDDLSDAIVWHCGLFQDFFSIHALRIVNKLALTFYQLMEPEKALRIIEKAIGLDRLRSDVKQTFQSDDSEKVTAIMKEMNSELSRTFQYHAIALYRLGKLDKAESSYLKSLELDPTNLSALSDYNLYLIDNKNSDYAFQQIDTILKNWGEKISDAKKEVSAQYHNKAIDLKQSGNINEAEIWYKRSLAIDPEDEKIHYNLALLYEAKRNYDKAISLHNKAIQLNPDYLNPYLRLGMISEDRDQNEAIKIYTKAHERGIGNEMSYANLGNCYFRKNNLDQAKKLYLKALEINDNHSDALNGMGIVYMEEGKSGNLSSLHKAAEYFKKAFTADPTFSGAQQNYHRALSKIQTLTSTEIENPSTTRKKREADMPISGPLLELILQLDDIKHKTGSFKCYGEDEKKVMAISNIILSSSGIVRTLQQLLSSARVSAHDDLILRSDLVGIFTEPRSMDSVFVPRDPERSEVFLPYLLYALGKLEMNFRSPQVQQELIAMGYDPKTVKLAPLLQTVAGARDELGIIGRERTVSFSIRYYYDRGLYKCNLAIGLPLLATRPQYDGIFQPMQLTLKGIDINKISRCESMSVDDTWKYIKENIDIDNNILSPFRQTHKAVLIPHKGIEYEPANWVDFHSIPELSIHQRSILPQQVIRRLIYTSAMVALEMYKSNTDEKGMRLDGLFVKENNEWQSPVLITSLPISE